MLGFSKHSLRFLALRVRGRNASRINHDGALTCDDGCGSEAKAKAGRGGAKRALCCVCPIIARIFFFPIVVAVAALVKVESILGEFIVEVELLGLGNQGVEIFFFLSNSNFAPTWVFSVDISQDS